MCFMLQFNAHFEHCFLYLLSFKQGPSRTKNSSDDTKNSSETLSPSKIPPPPGWTGAEVTYFQLLHPIFGHNYCTIAELLRTKNCTEVYKYSQLVSADLLLKHGGRIKRLAGKKKKRNMRSVLTFSLVVLSHTHTHTLTLTFTLTLTHTHTPGHGLTTIVRFSPNLRDKLPISTTTNHASTRGSLVITPVHV